jgi:hypothetical protein
MENKEFTYSDLQLVVDPATGGKSLRYGKDSEVVLPDPDGSGGSLGIFATKAALETAHPAASNAGYSAVVGADAPYVPHVSNGMAWVSEYAFESRNTPSDLVTNLVVGKGAMQSLNSGANIVIGRHACALENPIPETEFVNYVISIGDGSLRRSNLPHDTIVIGMDAVNTLTGEFANCVIVGNSAMQYTSEADSVIAIGQGACSGQDTVDQSLVNVTCIGQGALNKFSGQEVLALGFGAGKLLLTGDNNVIIGGNDGSTINGTTGNVLISEATETSSGGGKIRAHFMAGGGSSYFGNGVPASGLGLQGDYYFRKDGGTNTHIYFKSGETTWTGLV